MRRLDAAIKAAESQLYALLETEVDLGPLLSQLSPPRPAPLRWQTCYRRLVLGPVLSLPPA